MLWGGKRCGEDKALLVFHGESTGMGRKKMHRAWGPRKIR
jgi:hypothetical protein